MHSLACSFGAERGVQATTRLRKQLVECMDTKVLWLEDVEKLIYPWRL